MSVRNGLAVGGTVSCGVSVGASVGVTSGTSKLQAASPSTEPNTHKAKRTLGIHPPHRLIITARSMCRLYAYKTGGRLYCNALPLTIL